MKKFVKYNPNLKKNWNNKFFLNLAKFSFSIKSSQTELIENEIMKSFSRITKIYNISDQVKKNKEIYSYNDSNNISMDYIKNKYYNNPSTDEIEQIIKIIFREEVLNIKKEKSYEDLILFIKNCKKYDYQEYLTDVKYFKNKEIKNLMTNTNLLETLHQRRSPFNINKEFEMKFKVQNLYKLRKGEKGEKLDPMTENEFEADKYSYMNYLAETSTFEKINKLRKIEKNNSNLMKEFSQGDNLIDKVSDVGIKDEVWKNHYIQYYKKKKREERKESLGASRFEEHEFNEQIEKKAEKLFSKSRTNKTVDDVQFKATLNNTSGDRFVQNQATFLNNELVEPYPYFDLDDYPIEELFDETKTLPGKMLVFRELKPTSEIDILPPKIHEYYEDIYTEFAKWSVFQFKYRLRLMEMKLKSELQQILKSANQDLTKFDNFSIFDIGHAQSLIYYYNLLPKWAREHPTIKMVVRGLEFYQPWATMSEKINMLNLALKVLMKKDKYYNEITEECLEANIEDINQENIQELLNHDDDTERFVMQDPEDEATDDEEYETVNTAEEIRAIEKEEEEERKKKKKEEGRAKRAAEEAKQLAAEGKVDKAAEEKKKKEEAEKKKKDAEALENEGEEQKEEEVPVEEEEAETEDKSKPLSRNLEDKIFYGSGTSPQDLDDEEEIIDINDSILDKYSRRKGYSEEELEGMEEEDYNNDEEEGKNYYKYKQRRMQTSIDQSDEPLTAEEKIAEQFDDKLEDIKRFYKEERIVKLSKKDKLFDIIKDLKMSENIKVYENKLLIIRKNLEDASIRYETDANNEEVQVKRIDPGNDNLVIYPLSLLTSPQLNEEQKNILRNLFSNYIEMANQETNSNIIKFDEDNRKKTIDDLENEIMLKISKVETDVAKAETENYDIELDYKDSLKDFDIQVDTSEDNGLTDEYFKQRADMDYVERTEDPIPFDYFINEDGFWDDYIAFHKGRVDVKQLIHQPFNNFRNQIKKSTDIV